MCLIKYLWRLYYTKRHTSNLAWAVTVRQSSTNKAVMNRRGRRLCPRCCHMGSYFTRQKKSPVRPFACNWYYCSQFIAMPKAACALRFSWAATSSNLGLWANTMSSIKPEVHNVSFAAKGGTCIKNLVKIGRVVHKIWSRTEQTHRQTDKHVHRNTPLPYWGQSNYNIGAACRCAAVRRSDDGVAGRRVFLMLLLLLLLPPLIPILHDFLFSGWTDASLSCFSATRF